MAAMAARTHGHATTAEVQDRLTNIELSYEISLTGKRMTEAAHRLLRLLALLPDGLAYHDLSVVMPDQAEAAASVLRKAGLGFDEAERLRLLNPYLQSSLRRVTGAVAASRSQTQ